MKRTVAKACSRSPFGGIIRNRNNQKNRIPKSRLFMVDPVVKPQNAKIKRPPNLNDLAVFRIGVTGFEPAASWSRTKHSTGLSHTPIAPIVYHKGPGLSSPLPKFFLFRRQAGFPAYHCPGPRLCPSSRPDPKYSDVRRRLTARRFCFTDRRGRVQADRRCGGELRAKIPSFCPIDRHART